jgi:hypothetical protein
MKIEVILNPCWCFDYVYLIKEIRNQELVLNLQRLNEGVWIGISYNWLAVQIACNLDKAHLFRSSRFCISGYLKQVSLATPFI